MTRIVLTVLSLVVVAAAIRPSPAVSRVGDAIPRCEADRLLLRAGPYGEAAQQFIQTLTFVSESSRRCRLGGWPRLKVRTELGRLVPARTLRVVQGPPGAPPFRRVVLRPGGAASFDVYGADWNAAANRPCPKTAALVVTPPGDQVALEIRVRLPNCGEFLIAPLIPGRRDRDAWSRVWKP